MLRTSPMWNLTLSFARASRMSSCFFSSRLKIRISPTSVSRSRFSTALPNDPVPPVIIKVLFLNMNGAPRRRAVCVHLLDQLRPFGGDVPGCAGESPRVQRTIDANRVVRIDRDLLSVDVGD